MNNTRYIVMPDTCTLNAMTHPAEFPDGSAAFAAMQTGYFVRFPLTVLSEVIAKDSAADRLHVLKACRSLLRNGDCILPHHEILKLMIRRFEQGLPLGLNHVNLRLPEAEDLLLHKPDVFSDLLSSQERQENRDSEQIFKDCYRDIMTATPNQMPKSFAEFIKIIQNLGNFWKAAKNAYNRVAVIPATDEVIQKFYAQCEPFRALMVAIFAQVYNRIKPVTVSSMKAGRNDTFMATCLPLCDEFVTRDASLLTCYRAVISIAGLNVTVRSFEEFTGQFLVSRN